MGRFGQIIENSTGEVRYYNFSLEGLTKANFSQNITINCYEGCVINFTARTNDTSNNFRTNDTIITVVDDISPVVNTTLNKSLNSIQQNDIINITANITDETGLSFCQIIINQSGPNNLEFINISLEGLNQAQCSNSSQVTLSAGNVINYTIRVNDTNNNFRTNDTIITVADVVLPVVNTTFNTTSPNIGDVINFTGNVTDETGLLTANITYNISGITTYINANRLCASFSTEID